MPPPGASEKASQDPSGDQETDPTGSSNAVTCSGHPPSVATVKICGIPVMFETKAMRFPSGEKLGFEQNPNLTIAATDRSRSWAAAGRPSGSNDSARASFFILPPSARSGRKPALFDLDQDRVLRVHDLNDGGARGLRHELVSVHLREARLLAHPGDHVLEGDPRRVLERPRGAD